MDAGNAPLNVYTHYAVPEITYLADNAEQETVNSGDVSLERGKERRVRRRRRNDGSKFRNFPASGVTSTSIRDCICSRRMSTSSTV